MFVHDGEYLRESRNISSREETPRVTEASSSDHETIKVSEFLYAIVIVNHISVSDNWNREVFFEFIDPCPVSFSFECLLVGTSMDTDEVGSSILESFRKRDQMLFPVRPAETGLDGYRNLDCLTHLFDDTEGSIGIDHEARSMSALDHLLGGTTHIYVHSGCSGLLDKDSCLAEHLGILSEYLDDKGFFDCIMRQGCLLQLFRVNEAIRAIKFREADDFWSDVFDNLTIWRVAVAIHRGECWDRAFFGQVFPEIFRHEVKCVN